MKRAGSRLIQGLLAASSVIALSTAAVAGGPTGGTVVVGGATITSPSASQTVVNQSTSKALINWNSFSVPSGSSVIFNQPNVGSLTVNRVTGPNASEIDGQLLANGSIWLINANGVLFGHGSQVNVGAFLATTSDISDDDFRNGRYRFAKSSPNANAAVVNQGTITASRGGYVALSAPTVSNQGLIKADLGTVVLGGERTFTVDMAGDNLLRYQITAPATGQGNGPATVSNSGTLQANGGIVMMTARAAQNVQDNVINNTGHIEATSVSSRNGEIILDAGDGGTVNDSGTINASGRGIGQTGGSVAITGGTVNVGNGATVDASGDRGGGTIQIGGGAHGQGTIANAQTTNVGAATITADAVTSGNGGSITLWSNGTTSFAGAISARGGAQGGNGGAVETSGGHLSVGTSATVNTTAQKGLTGGWLVDPTDINIVSGGNSSVGTSDAYPNIDPSAIINALSTTNVTLEATHDITISSAIDYSSSNTLSLLAQQDIIAKAGIQNTGSGAINLVAGWSGNTDLTQLTSSGFYANSNGSVTIGGANAGGEAAVGSASGLTTIEGRNIIVEADNGVAQIGYHGAGGSGGIAVNATGNVTLTASNNSSQQWDAQIGNGGIRTQGDDSGNIAVNAGGDVTLTGGGGAYSFAGIGNGGDSSSGNYTGTVVVTAGSSVTITGKVDYAQIGNGGWGASGSSGGNVTVTASGNLSLTSAPSYGYAQIGNGAGDATNSDSVSGNVDVQVGGTTSFDNSAGESVWIGNKTNGATESGDVTFVTGSESDAASFSFSGMVLADLGSTSGQTGGNVTVGHTNSENGIDITNGISYSSPNTLSILTTGNLSLHASIQNSGSGGINLVGGWDGTTTALANLTNASVYGHSGGVTISSGVSVGSASGTTLVEGHDILVDGSSGVAQIGYNGSGGGNIDVLASGNLTLSGGNFLAQIGNGNHTVDPGGNISINVAGTTSLSGASDGAVHVWIGNIAAPNATESGDVTLVTGSVSNFDSSGGPNALGTMLIADLGTTSSSGSGGNVTFALTNPATSAINSQYLDIGAINYSSPNSLTLLSTGDITLPYSIQNAGTGALTVDAGWNGTTLGSGAYLASQNAYGIAQGDFSGVITVGGGSAVGSVSVGSAGGTAILGGTVNVDGNNGIATIGFYGTGGGGISVYAASDVNVIAASYNAFIGNGGTGNSGNVGGDIAINAGGNVTVSELANVSESGRSYAVIGNVSSNSTASASGNITVTATGALNVETQGSYGLAYLGNLSTISTSGGATGDITIHSGSVLLKEMTGGGQAIIGDGGVFSEAGLTGGNIQIATGTLTIEADANSHGVGQARIANRGVGTVTGNYNIITTGDISLSAGDGNLAAIGNGASGTGTTSGAISVHSGGNLSITATNSGEARIADGSAAGTDILVTAAGNITLSVTGNPDITEGGVNAGLALIGNFANGTSPIGGNITVTSTGGDIQLDAGESNSFVHIGNQSGTSVGGTVTVSAPGTGASSGTIQLIAGGSNSTVTIGNLGDFSATSGNILVTSGTNLALTASGGNALAQIGNGGSNMQGDASGNITLMVGGGLSLTSSAENAAALIGNGDSSQSGTGGASGNIDITVGGVTSFSSNSGNVWIGNLADPGHNESGNLTLITGSESDNGGDSLGNMIETDLGSTSGHTGGNVTVGFTDATHAINIDKTYSYSSPNSLVVLAAGNVTVSGTLENSSSGNIAIVGGWNGTTLDPTKFANVGVFGNQGFVTIGGTSKMQNAAIGSATGTTTILGDNIVVDGENGYSAIIGYFGTTTGSVVVDAVGALTLEAAAGSEAQIGGSATYGVVEAGTAVGITAYQFAYSGVVDVVGSSASFNDTSNGSDTGGWGTSHGQLAIAANTLSVMSKGDSVDLTSPNGGISVGVNGVGVNMGGGTLYFTANGAITQTAPISAGGLYAKTLSGDIVLTNTNNSFGVGGFLSAGNASVTDTAALMIEGAGVGSGDTLTLTALSLSQDSESPYAFGASILNATATGGDILLNKSTNAVGTATLSATGNATLTDSSALTIDGATVGSGNHQLILTALSLAQGTVAPNAISAPTLVATATGGGIVLNNSSNAVTAATLSATGNATFTDAGALTIDGASVGAGDTLTLSALSLGQGNSTSSPNDAIIATNLNATATNAITFNNSANAIGNATLVFAGNSSLVDSTALTIDGATDGLAYSLTLNAPSISQGAGTGNAIIVGTLNATATSGDISLNNASNAVATATLSATGNATLVDANALTIDGASVGSGDTLTLNALSLGQGTSTSEPNDAISATTLNATATGGNISLGNTGNKIANVTISASGNATITDSTALMIDGATVGSGNSQLTLTALSLSQGVGTPNAISAPTLNVTSTGGDIVLGNTANAIGTATVSAAGNAALFDTTALTVDGAIVGAGNGQLTLTALSLAQGGGSNNAISAPTLIATATGGDITLNNTANAVGIASFSATGNALFDDSVALTISGANVALTLTLVETGGASSNIVVADNATPGGTIDQTGAIVAGSIVASTISTTNGAITLTNSGNQIGTVSLTTAGTQNASLTDAIGLSVSGATIGGTLTLSDIGTTSGTIGQTGAITAGTLSASTASTTNGTITLTYVGNQIGTASLATAGAQNASLEDAIALTISGADVSGTLTLMDLAGTNGTIGQTGAIIANGLVASSASTSGGDITLTNTGNQIGSASLSTSGNALLTDSVSLTMSGGNVGGALTLSDVGTTNGAIGQSAAFSAGTLNATTASATNGAITLTTSGNQIGTASLTTAGTQNASLTDAASLTISSANVGGTLTLADTGGTIGQSGAITAGTLNAATSSTSNGAITLTTSGNQIGTASLTTAGTQNASLTDAASLTISGATVGGTLTLADTGGTIGQSGAITAGTLSATTSSTSNGAITLTTSGNQIGTASLTTAGTQNASLTDAASLTISSANVGGTLTLSDVGAEGGSIGQTGAITAGTLNASTVATSGGDISLTNAANQIGTLKLATAGSSNATVYDTSNLTVDPTIGGNLTVLTRGNLTFIAPAQLSTGSLVAVAGWDGTTTNPANLTTSGAYGNNGGSIVIGGNGAAGNVAIGSASGTTTLAAANVSLDATNGYAQVGYHGAGSGNIVVVTTGDVNLNGGGSTGYFAQIGNGGYQVSGNESGNIAITAAGNVSLGAGSGQEAYAQIGHGGAESNSGAASYSNVGALTVNGAKVVLAAGSGTGSYAQIGQGGYLSGHSLGGGTATLGGAITVAATTGVVLTGNGSAGYAQIGNGGDLVNSNAANSSNGTISGDINVSITTPPAGGNAITETAGAGNASYVQIGNGGSGENMPATGATVSFTISGNVTIDDLALTGSNTGADAYAQVGDGDASKLGSGNITGSITIGAGTDFIVTNGTAPGAGAIIGDATGAGSVSGTITGYTPPGQDNSQTNGAVASTTQTQTTPTDTNDTVATYQTAPNNPGDTTTTSSVGSESPTPLDQLADSGSSSGSSEGVESSDGLSQSLGQSLDPTLHKTTVVSTTIIPGVLTQIAVIGAHNPHGVPPVDEDYSSWGNEALWQW